MEEMTSEQTTNETAGQDLRGNTELLEVLARRELASEQTGTVSRDIVYVLTVGGGSGIVALGVIFTVAGIISRYM